MQSTTVYSVSMPVQRAGSVTATPQPAIADEKSPPSAAARDVDAGPREALRRQSTAHPDPYVLFRQALRGRYIQFITLAVIGADLGACTAWKFGKPLYRSEARIRIAY